MSAIFTKAQVYCQAGYTRAKEAINEGIEYASNNPQTVAKVVAYAISALAAIGTIALVGSAIASFTAAAIFPGTITVCFALFIGVIAHDSFKIAKNLETQEELAKGDSLIKGVKAAAAQGKELWQKLNPFSDARPLKEQESPYTNAILEGTLISKIPGVKGIVGAIHTELSKA